MLDSGVGGLSIFKEIMEYPVICSIDYVCDHLYFPYGLKNPEILIERVQLLVTEAVRESESYGKCYQAIVIACNTASTQVLDGLRRTFDIPVIGVVPAIKPAAQSSKNGSIGVLATDATVQGTYLKALIRDFAQGVEVEVLGTPQLVEFAEAKLAGKPVDLTVLANILSPFKERNVDHLVLGCTHFPLLRAEIQQVCDWPVTLIDSGYAIARRLSQVLNIEWVSSDHQAETVSSYHRFLTTAHTLPDIRLLHSIFDETRVDFAQPV